MIDLILKAQTYFLVTLPEGHLSFVNRCVAVFGLDLLFPPVHMPCESRVVELLESCPNVHLEEPQFFRGHSDARGSGSEENLFAAGTGKLANVCCPLKDEVAHL